GRETAVATARRAILRQLDPLRARVVLFRAMSPPKSSSPASGAEGQSADEAETITVEDPSNGQVVRALYVTGPRGGVRHVLPLGVVSIGRGAEATIVVPDPRVSRAHAVLHVGDSIELG